VDLISKTLIKNFKVELKGTSVAEADTKQRLLENTQTCPWIDIEETTATNDLVTVNQDH
ncbi:hypothetical protein Goshw_021180, partial [Gossypium schwendimanii]|nr:hypothetical protein [Gossypium schwendimanii]